MARRADKIPENAPGEFFVDSSCIDCDQCRQVAPTVFGRSSAAAQSFVHHQPATGAERLRAQMGLVTCPTASIGTAAKSNLSSATQAFPELLEEEVYFCGFASERSFGASSYLIRRAEGNVLVDSPRAAKALMDRLEELGGVRWMFLTHRDDVADHQAYRERFGCERILHRADAGHGLVGLERLLDYSFTYVLPGHGRRYQATAHQLMKEQVRRLASSMGS